MNHLRRDPVLRLAFKAVMSSVDSNTRTSKQFYSRPIRALTGSPVCNKQIGTSVVASPGPTSLNCLKHLPVKQA